MAEDRREAILTRIEAVAKTVINPENVFRNQLDIPEDKLPAIAILDGDESADESGFGRGRVSMSEIVIELMPHIVLMLCASPENIGPALNVLKCSLLKALLSDAMLVATCKDGEILYHGFETALGVGRSMEGEGVLSMTFRYVLRPNKL